MIRPELSETLPEPDHFTFEFDAAHAHRFDSPSRIIENDYQKLFGEYGVDIFETGSVHVLQVWLCNLANYRFITTHLITDASKTALAQTMMSESDQIAVAADGLNFEIDTPTLHLTGRVVNVSLRPDGSFDKVTIETEVTAKLPQPAE